ncbi:MAG: class I SAM-dependent methyltransferase [Planctomycetes bacterium]|nr:class I SAM-dependent methyltransferase [Planctomycetota bacterium]
MDVPHEPADRDARVCLNFLRDLLAGYRPPEFRVRLWDGTTWQPDPAAPVRFTLRFEHPGAVRNVFARPSSLSIGEAFVRGEFDVEGDFEAACALADYLFALRPGLFGRLRYLLRVRTLPRGRADQAGAAHPGSRAAAGDRNRVRDAVNYHYELPPEFFAVWLDRQVVYSCAYFGSPDDALDAAQERKLDYVCRKLDLRPGERFFDLGCGWGALVVHAARHYGVEATGVTLSPKQAEVARQRIAAAGVADRCRVEVLDYRDADPRGGFDKMASVGAIEHVPAGRLGEYFAAAWRLLRPGGRFLNHGITLRPTKNRPRQPSFFKAYVFPDGHLAPLSETLTAAESVGFEVRDVESLREHYALTLRAWRRRLEDARGRIEAAWGEPVWRVFRLYLTAAAYDFANGRNNLHQTLLVKPDGGRSGLPLTRARWYPSVD